MRWPQTFPAHARSLLRGLRAFIMHQVKFIIKLAHSWHDSRTAFRWLVDECGVNANVATGDGTTPFHYAVWQGHLAVCKWLVYSGAADLASTNEFGCNAIQWAAQTDNLRMCRWLAALGLDLAIVNNNGHSALHKAANKGQARVCTWLINEECLGTRHLQPDQDGNSPAVMARLEGHHALADALDAALHTLQRREGETADAEVATMYEPPLAFSMTDAANGAAVLAQDAGVRSVRKGSSESDRSGCVRAARLQQAAVRFPLLATSWLNSLGRGGSAA